MIPVRNAFQYYTDLAEREARQSHTPRFSTFAPSSSKSNPENFVVKESKENSDDDDDSGGGGGGSKLSNSLAPPGSSTLSNKHSDTSSNGSDRA